MKPLLTRAISFLAGMRTQVRNAVRVVMPWVVVLLVAVAMLFDPSRDTLGVSGTAFAAAAALAGITFAYARALKEGSAVRDELIFAGERLVVAAVAFLLASIVRHAANDVPRYLDLLSQSVPHTNEPEPMPTLFGQSLFGLLVGVLALIVFLVGLIYAQMGAVILLAVAGRRAKRRPDHADYFDSANALERRIAELEQADRNGQPAAKS